MTWNALSYSYQSQLNTTKIGQNQENFAAMAGAHAGAPTIGEDAMTASVVHRASLGTATSSANFVGNVAYILTGGSYSWYTLSSGNGALPFFSGADEGLGVIRFFNTSPGMYVDERYIQSSPPYDLGDGFIPLFIFAVMDRNGSVMGVQVAPDPPWANNGPTCLTPQRLTGDGRKYRCYKRLGFGGPLLAELSSEKQLAYLRGELELVDDWVELTPEWKNRDQHLFPHPFEGSENTVVIIDPFSTKLIDRLFTLHESVGAREIRQLFIGGYITIDNETTKMRGLRGGVVPVQAKLKST